MDVGLLFVKPRFASGFVCCLGRLAWPASSGEHGWPFTGNASMHRLRFATSGRALLAALLLSTLSACDDGSAQREAQAAALARAEADAAALQRHMEQAITEGRPDLARAYAEDLVSRHPSTTSGQAVARALDGLRRAADEYEQRRHLQALWTYHAVDDAKAGGMVHTAYIHGVSAAGAAPDVRLVLRRHPQWGQSAYLLIAGGDFACQNECNIDWKANDEDAGKLLISRAKDVDPPAVFIERDAEFLARLTNAYVLELALPLLAGETVSYRFEVSGFDLERLGPEITVK